ncbi:DNA oxidative demethylase AlkB [Oceanospirillum sanctuarii]|uniref:DNA oxidative demethylase AlkB n=1 Tax=Oceanospirillum sanctuarii TaxID=1434821 RepID=UPI000A3BC158|nr:DNA oxidative demethylase AlkB [Oceanospirillum sanctuarii]
MQQDLFLQQDDASSGGCSPEDCASGDCASDEGINKTPDFSAPKVQVSDAAWLFKAALKPVALDLLQQIEAIAKVTPFRQRRTPGGQLMSAAMTNCGRCGWVTDQDGYRYSESEPETGENWLAMPDQWLRWATRFSEQAGFGAFVPDACLINRYAPGAGMGLHQDRDESDLSAPIVSFSLGAPVIFRWGGFKRQESAREFLLEHGDVLVWGGTDRMRFHGVKKLQRYQHPITDHFRYNLTFRRS